MKEWRVYLSHSIIPHQMVEEWLDKRALELIRTTEPLDDDISVVSETKTKKKQPSEKKEYNPQKLDVFLPNTTDIEQIEYFPPDISKSSEKCSNSTNLQFVEPKPRFDMFEHLSFKVIPLSNK